MSQPQILALDLAGAPHRWIDLDRAVQYYAEGKVAYTLGEQEFTFHGGIQRVSGEQSKISAGSIIAIRGVSFITSNYDRVPTLTKHMLLVRDRRVCAYCGNQFPERFLDMEHIHPESRGGKATWTNLVTACKDCNNRKRNRTPEEAKMPLLYVPYVPNRHESFILSAKKILADQMDYLLAGVPRHSRLHMPLM